MTKERVAEIVFIRFDFPAQNRQITGLEFKRLIQGSFVMVSLNSVLIETQPIKTLPTPRAQRDADCPRFKLFLLEINQKMTTGDELTVIVAGWLETLKALGNPKRYKGFKITCGVWYRDEKEISARSGTRGL
jgi:hypothetical protein